MALLGAGAAACEAAAPRAGAGAGEDSNGPADQGSGRGGSIEAISYHRDIRPVLEASCVECHARGGIAPFALDDWSTVKALGPAIVAAVESGAMPPSPWNRACRELHDDRSLSGLARALFSAWQVTGYAEGDPGEYAPPAARAGPELGEPSLVMSAGVSYTPPANADEYRCFVLDRLERDSYLTALQILPGQPSEVHHVQIHRVSAEQYASVRSKDQSDPKPGYVCSGGTGVESQNMFSYRPGSEAVGFDRGDAAYIEGGSGLIIQVHYNTVFLPATEPPLADETKIALWTLPDGELPERVVYRTTVFGPVDLPAGDANVLSTVSRAMKTLSSFGGSFGGAGTFVPGEVVGMTPHAHQLAISMSASLARADGSSACLDDVPNWDFHWQLDYLFKEGVPYGPDDELTGNCIYDNSADNQPIIDGVRQQPRRVTFGERSIDEMCQHYIWLRFDRAAFLAAR